MAVTWKTTDNLQGVDVDVGVAAGVHVAKNDC